jgi:hypothetical protein
VRLLIFVSVVVLFGGSAASADTQPGYMQAVDQTYNLVRNATPADTATAREALAVLEAGTGHSQPEIISDLQRKPPDFEDASNRLQALLAELNKPTTTSDPANAQQQLHDVLAMHRYDALHRAPTVLDRFLGWLHDRWNDLLRFLFGGRGGGAAAPVPDWFFYAAGAIALATVAVIIFRSARGQFANSVVSSAPSGPRAPADYFSEADRLAASGDYVGAVRALCAGVAATLAGERTWEGSPLTVREIFQHASDPARLQPLLRPFEAAVYGGRDVDAATYARAAQIAAAFRVPSDVAA